MKYQLTESEILEALLCLDFKREGRFGRINAIAVSILGVFVLLGYIRNPEQFFLFLLLLLMILLIFYIKYGPAIGRARRAKKMAGEKGEYLLDIESSRIVYGKKQEKLSYAGKKIYFFVSENIYVLKIDREVFAIPKHILSDEDEKRLTQIMDRENVNKINIVIERK